MPEDILVQALKRGPRSKHRPNIHKFKEALHLLELAIMNKAEQVPLHRHEDVFSSDKKQRPCLEQGP